MQLIANYTIKGSVKMSNLQKYITEQQKEVDILNDKAREMFVQACKIRNEKQEKQLYIKELSCLDFNFKWRKSNIIGRDIPYIYYMFSFYRPHTYTANKQDIYIYLYHNENNKKFKYRVKVDAMLDIHEYKIYNTIQVEFLQTYYNSENNTKDNYFDDIINLDKVNKNFKTEEEATQYIYELIKQFNIIIRDNIKFKEFISICGEEYDKLDTITDMEYK